MINLTWFLSIIFTSPIQIILAAKTKLICGIIIPLLYAGFFLYAVTDLAGKVPNYVCIGYALPVVWHILIFAIFYLRRKAGE